MYNHGIKTVEAATSAITPIESGTVQVIIGVAPINHGKRENVNTPVVCHSFAEFVSEFGYLATDWDKYTLCRAAYVNFNVFNNSPIAFINVLDPSKEAHITADNEEEVSISTTKAVTAILPKTTILDSIVVTAGDATLAKDTDYTVKTDSDGNVLVVFPAATAVTRNTIAYSVINPAAITADDIVGVDTVGAEKGIGAVRKVFPKTGYIPSILLAPGFSQNASVALKLQSTAELLNGAFKAIAIVDLNTTTVKNYADVKEAKERFVVASNAIVCWPKVAIGGTQFYLSEALGAMMQYTDATHDSIPYYGPSNQPIKAEAVVLEDGTELLLDETQANALNAAGVVTVVNNGSAFVAWGNNTSAYPATTDVKDRYIMVKRMFNYAENRFIRTYKEKVDNPMNRRLIDSICDSENIFYNSLVARNIIAGGNIQYLDSENPLTDVLNGKLKLHTYFAPYTPAEYIENTVEYDVSALETALGG